MPQQLERASIVLDRASPVPLYAQLRDGLRARIKDGLLNPGDRLPTEKDLMAQYSLSSSAVRQALLGLVQEGLIERTAGKGSFVRAHYFYADHVDSMISFSAQLEAQGHRPALELLEFQFEPASDTVARALEIPAGTEAFKIVRLQRANDEAILLITVYHPRDLGLRILPHENAMRQPNRHRFYAEELGIRLASISRTFEATLATAEQARKLGIPIAAPVLVDERILADESGRPIEYARAVCRGDRCRYQLRVVAGEPLNSVIGPVYGRSREPVEASRAASPH